MGPHVCKHSADEHLGDLSAEGSSTASTQWVGGVGAAEPGESTSHLEMEQVEPAPGTPPPGWALLPAMKPSDYQQRVEMPKYRAVPPARGIGMKPGMVPVSLEEEPSRLN